MLRRWLLRNYAGVVRASVRHGRAFHKGKQVLMFRKILFSALAAAAFWACNSPVEPPDAGRLGHDFFPLETGRQAMYDVQRIVYKLGSRPDTQRYQLRETVADTFTDLSGQAAFKIHRFVRANARANWRLDSVWTAKRTAYTALRTENNVGFVKLSFPPREKLAWNGNAYNDFPVETYEIRDFDRPFRMADTVFRQTLKVFQKEDSSGVANVRRVEVYARGAGLIERTNLDVKYDQRDFGSGRIESGVDYVQRLAGSGK